ncbi:MAG: hypothetical protein A2X32_09925 [Elusimicrobia bacterium GWC2_64_44]|nr:MAG: hypothetical protein A2X32_09925 [Elusimicrobia bacterium GWC2_64_44]
MNDESNKADKIFERLKGGSVFSFLKSSEDAAGAASQFKSEPLAPPEFAKPQQDVTGLKNKLAELEMKIKRLETEAETRRVAASQSGVPDSGAAVNNRLAALEAGMGELLKKTAQVPGLEANLKRMIENSENELKDLITGVRNCAESKAAEMAEHAAEMERAAGADRRAGAAGADEIRRWAASLDTELRATLAGAASAMEKTAQAFSEEESRRRKKFESEIEERFGKIESVTAGILRSHETELAELTRRGETYAAGLKGTLGELGDLQEHLQSLERLVSENNAEVRTLVAAERGQRKKLESEARARLTKIECETVGCRQEYEAEFAEFKRRAESCAGALNMALKKLDAVKERCEATELSFYENKAGVSGLISDERGLREKAESETALRLGKLESEVLNVNESMDQLCLEVSSAKDLVLAEADKVIREAHELLGHTSRKMREEVMAAASAKLSALKAIWQAAGGKIKNAQQAAFLALEKCEKLDKRLFSLDHKTDTLEKKYLRDIEEPLKPSGSVEERPGDAV